MPVAPVVQRYTQQVQQQGTTNARLQENAPVEAFGGGAVTKPMEALGNFADTVNKIAVDEKRKGDEIAVADAITKAKQKKVDLLMNEKTGALFQKGKDAFGLPDTVPQDFNKFGEELLSSLSNDEQKEATRRALNNEGVDINEKIQTHVGRERQAYDLQVTDGLVKTAADEAVLNFQDPQKVADSIALMRGAVIKNAERQGRSGVEVDRIIADQTSAVHAAIVERHLNLGDDRTAQAYYEQNKASFNGKDSSVLDKALEEGSRRGQSQRESDKIVTSTSDMGTALEQVRQIEDPKLRDDTMARVKDFFQSKKAAQEEAQEKSFENVMRQVETTKSRDAISPSVWSQMKPALRNQVDARIKQLREGVQPETKWDDYYNLKTTASTPETRDQFLKTNLMQYRTIMADPEFKELVSLQTSLREKDGKAEKALDSFRSDQSIVNDALNAVNIDPTPKPGSNDAVKVNDFRRRVDEQVRTLQERTGKKATNAEVQSIVDGMIVKGVTEKRSLWFDKEERLFETKPGTPFEVDAKNVPPSERALIEQALKKRNLPVTDDAVANLYNKKLKGLNSAN